MGDRLEHVQAADPPAFTWYVETYGPEVNLFVDHSQMAHRHLQT